MKNDLSCPEVCEQLAGLGPHDLTLSLRRHVSRCDECRRELARYEDLKVALADLGAIHPPVSPPASLRAALVSIPRQESPVARAAGHLGRYRSAYAGGAALAAAGLAGALLWRRRRPAAA